MMKTVRSVIVLVALVASGTATAQTTGADVLGTVWDDLSHNTAYRVEHEPARVRVCDAASGRELFCVVAISADALSMQGDVARHVSNADLGGAREHIDHFNCSAPVGTLVVDKKGGVMLQHYVNPSLVPALTISKLAQRFGDAIRVESRTLSSQ